MQFYDVPQATSRNFTGSRREPSWNILQAAWLGGNSPTVTYFMSLSRRQATVIGSYLKLNHLDITAISMQTTPSPTAVMTVIGKIFQKANMDCFMGIPFWLRIPLHNSPAKLAENVKLTAPTLLATAKAIAAALKLWSGNAAARTTFVKRIVAPILVPERLQRTTPKTPTIQMVG